MPLIGRTMLDRMRERGWQPYAVGGLTMGADPVVAAIARESLEYGMIIHSFLIRKEAKKHGRQQFLEGIADPAGRDVVIIDDVCTTGGSTILAIDRAREAGMNVLGALCIVDREEGGREAIEQGQNCLFERVFTMKELLDSKGAA
jgi:orotate phosphoribosyltransferase